MTDKFQDKLVLFGAGKIGRSFIGQLFSRGGYEVVFIDVFRPVIEELNLRNNYNVKIKSDVETVINIQNVRGVFGGDTEQVIDEIATARIVAVSVGQIGLKTIIPLIAKGLMKRYESAGAVPLDVIDQGQGAREQCFPRATWQRSWPHAHKPCRWTDSDLANLPTLRQTVRGATCSREAASSTAITMTGKGASSSRWARCATNEGGTSPLASACPSVSAPISQA